VANSEYSQGYNSRTNKKSHLTDSVVYRSSLLYSSGRENEFHVVGKIFLVEKLFEMLLALYDKSQKTNKNFQTRVKPRIIY